MYKGQKNVENHWYLDGLGKIYYEFQFGFYRCEKSQAEKEKDKKIALF